MRQLIEEITSTNRTHKVEIVRRPDGNLQVLLFEWWEEDVPDYGKLDELWAEVRIPATITDSVEHARTIARELLRNHAGPGDAGGEAGGHE